jgi:hypothetical protein
VFDVDKLLQLELFNQVVPIWQVFFFIVALVPFLVVNRLRICLFLTYLFTFYLGFLVQWGDYLASAGALFPFMLYAFSGMFVSLFFVVLVFREEGFQIRLNWRKSPAPLKRFNIDDSPAP